MSTTIGWPEIALRLALTIVAGALIGFNRGEHGRPAGLRTTLLVCLAASIAMIQANLLLGTVGKASDSFISLDLMRLPLGILSGMGFIGAGAILRRDNIVLGVTTAATLWFVTVVGLCFGGGQIGLGLAALVLGSIVLWGLQLVEQRTKRDRRGNLVLIAGADGPTEEEILACIAGAKYQIISCGLTYRSHGQQRKLSYEVQWRERPTFSRSPAFFEQLVQQPGVLELDWSPVQIE